MGFTSRLAFSMVVSVTLLSGCRTAPAPIADKPFEQPGVTVAKGASPVLIPVGPDNRGVDPDKLVGKSACGNQLHDIEGALLMYYAVHKAMPAKLEDLQPLADSGSPLIFKCPKSGEAYIYSPIGLVRPGMTKIIVVYDATPAHNGYRWCLLVDESRPGSIATEVTPIKEDLFQQYSPAAP